MSTTKDRRSSPVTVGCDVGGTAVKLVRLHGEMVEETLETPTPAGGSPAATVTALLRAIRRVAEPRQPGGRAGGQESRPLPSGVGVALPGYLDPQRSRVVYLSNVPALNGVDLKSRLERRLSLPVILDTDSNAGAVAEARLGAGVGRRRVLYLTLGTGVGAALVVDGAPVRVSRHTVGHVAHVPLDPAGPRCRCGGGGCAEAVLSAGGVLWRARRHGLRRIATTEALAELAHDRAADPSRRTAARAVWRETGEALGRLCVTLGSLLHPDGIVVGGGVAGAAADFLPAARRHLDRHLPRRVGHSVSLDAAATGRTAGALGAALLARGAS